MQSVQHPVQHSPIKNLFGPGTTGHWIAETTWPSFWLRCVAEGHACHRAQIICVLSDQWAAQIGHIGLRQRPQEQGHDILYIPPTEPVAQNNRIFHTNPPPFRIEMQN